MSKSLTVAIQGVQACFHDVAARKYFSTSTITPIECSSFRILCDSLSSRKADFAIMAIENTIAGSILPNYALLEKNDFKILGEVYLRIEMCLLALPGQSIEDIRFVQSHPMAILQCQEFLAQLQNVKLIEASDTAESAMEISQKGLKQFAAIASRLAGETYGLNILKENIETDPSNYTRFLVLCRSADYVRPEDSNKTSIRFETGHTPGCLAKILTVFSAHQLNLTKIQSIPVLGKPYQYAFHVDLEWSDYSDFTQALAEMKVYALNIVQFGEYQRGERRSVLRTQE